MEDPDFRWDPIGEADGGTTKEVADNLALVDKSFAEYYDPTTNTFWGWKLSIFPGWRI